MPLLQLCKGSSIYSKPCLVCGRQSGYYINPNSLDNKGSCWILKDFYCSVTMLRELGLNIKEKSKPQVLLVCLSVREKW